MLIALKCPDPIETNRTFVEVPSKFIEYRWIPEGSTPPISKLIMRRPFCVRSSSLPNSLAQMTRTFRLLMLKWSISNCFSSIRAELAKSPATPAPAQLERNSWVGLLKLQSFGFPNLQYVIVQTIDLPTITRHHQVANRRSAVSA